MLTRSRSKLLTSLQVESKEEEGVRGCNPLEQKITLSDIYKRINHSFEAKFACINFQIAGTSKVNLLSLAKELGARGVSKMYTDELLKHIFSLSLSAKFSPPDPWKISYLTELVCELKEDKDIAPLKAEEVLMSEEKNFLELFHRDNFKSMLLCLHHLPNSPPKEKMKTKPVSYRYCDWENYIDYYWMNAISHRKFLYLYIFYNLGIFGTKELDELTFSFL